MQVFARISNKYYIFKNTINGAAIHPDVITSPHVSAKHAVIITQILKLDIRDGLITNMHVFQVGSASSNRGWRPSQETL